MKESAERVGMACLVPNEPANRHLLTIRFHDEFGKLRAAIVHDGSNAIDITLDDLPPEELKQPEPRTSSKERLVEQHGRLRKLLADSGVNLFSPEPQMEAYGRCSLGTPVSPSVRRCSSAAFATTGATRKPRGCGVSARGSSG